MWKRLNTLRLQYGYNTVRISVPDNTVWYRPKTNRKYTDYRTGKEKFMAPEGIFHPFNMDHNKGSQ